MHALTHTRALPRTQSIAHTQLILLRLAATVLQLAAATNAQADIPRTAEGRPDFSGIWQTLSAADYGVEAHGSRPDAPPGPGIVEGGVIPYTEAALAQRERNFAARETADPAKQRSARERL